VRAGRIALLSAITLVAVAALGPREHVQSLTVNLPTVPTDPVRLQAWVDAGEAAQPNLRADSRARIVWADPAHPARASCAIVYLHGFGASQGEGAPLHRELARDFGCNLYLSRLPGHGLRDAYAMRGLTAQRLLDGAAQALAIGHALGDRVVLIGTSMGGALAIELAARRPAGIAALVLWSPFVRERDDRLQPLFWPWGPLVMRYLHNHGDVLVPQGDRPDAWARFAHLDGYRSLAVLGRSTLVPATFADVRAPVFLGYYYRDAQHQDPTVSVAAMLAMFDALGTPAPLKRAQDFPDADAHVIGSPLRSRSADAVYRATRDFLHDAVRLPYARDRAI
jgi:pimeloyl-ACP methyl ester carboxylesterase